MRITFDPDFDSGYWPGPLRSNPPQHAVAGNSWVGFHGLRGILETATGLTGLFPSHAERTVALAKTALSRDGFWSQSAQKDPIGVARTLLRWIDWLSVHGWDGRVPASSPSISRLHDLSRLLPELPSGGIDRLAAIGSALDRRRPDIESVISFEPIERLPRLWRSVFAKLIARGVLVRFDPTASSSGQEITASTFPSHSKGTSDLRRSLSPGFVPSGDGSLVLLRAYNPLDAAENAAAWLSSYTKELDNTVIITTDVVLDEALRRFGLPVTGARESSNDDPYLQVLPLVLAMGWDPPDPQRALELLLLPDGPVPSHVARGLRNALQQWPSVGSPDWKNTLEESLEGITDSDFRRSLEERLKAIFLPQVKIRSPFPADALKCRAAAVKKWASTRRFAPPGVSPELTPTPSSPDAFLEKMDAVIAQCSLFEMLIDLFGQATLSEPQILKLNTEIADSVRSGRRYVPQAGITTVESPGAIAGPARRILWWNFSLESTPSPFSIPLSRVELAALESQGIVLTPAAELAADQARRWRRPFIHAAESLVLVSPTFGEDNEERHHHPFWDEVIAVLAPKANLSFLERKRLPLPPSVPTRTDAVLPLPASTRSWNMPPRPAPLVARHSPTGLLDLIGCPFKWALRNLGHLRDPEIAALTDGATLIGTFSHEILAEVLKSNPSDPDLAAAEASKLFDELGPSLAAPLFLPGAPIQIAAARKATADATRDLVDTLRCAHLAVKGVETSVSRKTDGFELTGRMDLVAGNPPVIIDLKWGGESYRREQLKNGTAAQLAAYAFIAKSGRKFAPGAFYIIRSQRLIAQKDNPFLGIDGIEGPSLSDTWDALRTTALANLAQLEQGHVTAAAIPLETVLSASNTGQDGEDDNSNESPAATPETSVLKKDELTADGCLALAPPCDFCSFGFLCGLEWGKVQ